MKKKINLRAKGINAALFSAFFLGLAPIFGKQAIEMGVNPLGVVAMRTLFATLLLFVAMLLFQRKYLYIYPAGLIGCLMAGIINGIGSLFYYSALGKIDAGLGQMLYMLYPFFVAFWMFLDKQSISRITIYRLLIAVPAVFLVVQTGENSSGEVWIGILMMLVSSVLYALHLPVNQRVLYDIPAPTVTLYTLLAMSVVVVPTYLLSGQYQHPVEINGAWVPVLMLTLVTFFSRLTLFTGVKHLGGLQTALLGLSELLITLILSIIWLGESLTWMQWIGAGLICTSLFLVAIEKPQQRPKPQGGFLGWLSSPQALSPRDIFRTRD
ncbi:MAG: DMT family transporter [Anaerolineales bacterium]|nr:DMT family transporter [Anaerolineales bacterium]